MITSLLFQYRVETWVTCTCICGGFFSGLCCCGSAGRRSPACTAGAAWCIAPFCSLLIQNWYLQENARLVSSNGVHDSFIQRERLLNEQRAHGGGVSPCHRGSSVSVFSIMAWLARTPGWRSGMPSPDPSCPFWSASCACSSLRDTGGRTHAALAPIGRDTSGGPEVHRSRFMEIISSRI